MFTFAPELHLLLSVSVYEKLDFQLDGHDNGHGKCLRRQRGCFWRCERAERCKCSFQRRVRFLEDQKEGIEAFMKKWNKKNKKGMKASETGGAYRLVIKPTELHFGSAALALTIGFGAGGMKMSGTMELYQGKKRVLVIKVDEQTGKSKMTETQRYRSLMEELADDTYKDILK